METNNPKNFQEIVTSVIKRQILILGPDITLIKTRNVKELSVADDGSVTQIGGQEKELAKKLVAEFIQLSSSIVKITMGELLARFPDIASEYNLMPLSHLQSHTIQTRHDLLANRS